jgi:hypothetical protein
MLAERPATRSTEYPFQLQLTYEARGGRPLVSQAGTGQTERISNTSVIFEADRKLKTGVTVELAIQWPAVPKGKTKQQLVLLGDIVDSHGRRTEVKIRRYRFARATRTKNPPRVRYAG